MPIRVVTAELPRILDDIVDSIFRSAGDIQVLARAGTRAELLELTRVLHPDVVIIGFDDHRAVDVGWELFACDPLLRVLGITGEGRLTFAYELRPQRTPLGELSPEELVSTVRHMAEARLAATGTGGLQ